ncbi:MAG: hypothetical protein ACRDNT_29680 [Streptosporangiaceae bacterium]
MTGWNDTRQRTPSNTAGKRVIAANAETPPMHRLNSPIAMSRVPGRVRAYSSEPTTSRLSVNPWVVTPPWLRC